MKIEIHGTDDKGVPFIINHLSGENVELSNGGPAKKAALIDRATKMAGDWSKVFPHDKFKVVEV